MENERNNINPEKIYLNSQFKYVCDNIVLDLDQQETYLNDDSSFYLNIICKNGGEQEIVEGMTQQVIEAICENIAKRQLTNPKHVFIPNELIYYLVGKYLSNIDPKYKDLNFDYAECSDGCEYSLSNCESD